MITNYYTLRHITLDLDRTLSHARIEEIYCQSKNELMILCKESESLSTLVISCEPSRNCLFLRSPVGRARKNSIDLFQTLEGKSIRGARIHPSDREIILLIETGERLIIQIYGSKANVLLVDPQDSIVESFLQPRELAGKKFVEQRPWIHQTQPTLEAMQGSLQAIGFLLATAAVKKILPAFDSLMIREAFHRSGVPDQRLAAELTQVEIQTLLNTTTMMVSALMSSAKPRIYYEGTAPRAFSILPLFHLQDLRAEDFQSIHDAIRVFVSSSHKQTTLIKEKETLVRFLDQNIDRAHRTLQKMAVETAAFERAATYEAIGKILMANLQQLQKGMTRFEGENIFSAERERMTIQLEPALTPARNAERYFEKAKKARASMQEKLERQREVEERWELLRELRDQLEPLQMLDQFREFITGHREQLAKLGYKIDAGKGKETAPEVPFRVFTVAGGFQVWAGKSRENNDLLTMKYAKPNDLWFHARGSGGSHVILRAGTGKGEISKRAKEQAAAIAAYYSKMKTSKTVPVAMTLRKYVRKPKGAAPGTVTIEREKLLFVEPSLPEDA